MKLNSISDVPGYASNVWGGFVWIDNEGQEQRWSKRASREECESVVLEVVNRLGIDAAFAD